MVRVFIDKNQLAAILTASAFPLIGPDAGYTGVHIQAEICPPKTMFWEDVFVLCLIVLLHF